jgi:hypothetical protein
MNLCGTWLVPGTPMESSPTDPGHRPRQVTDGRGWPTVANIVRAGDDGRPARVFMPEELFGPQEYRQSDTLQRHDAHQ